MIIVVTRQIKLCYKIQAYIYLNTFESIYLFIYL